jgi:HEPN domain-containing protein
VALPKKTSDGSRTQKIVSFLRDSFNDYIAARVLFRAQLPEQAAILSSTAIEKSVKAMLAFSGNESHGHLKKAHRNFVRKFNPSLYEILDDDFLVLNQRIYSLRYTDDLSVDFNVVIASREFLAEMDHTIYSMFSCFSLDVAGKPSETPYATASTQRDERLLADNHVIARVPKDIFIYQEPQFVYELRKDPLRGLMQITYLANGPAKGSGFLRPG